MRFTHPSFTRFNHLVLACLLTTAGASAMAQTVPAPAATTASSANQSEGYSGQHMGHHDPARMQARIASRQAGMKAKLNITPAQEGAWTSFTAAMQPPVGMHTRQTPEQRAAFDKLSTPERIDKMRAMRAERMTAMSARMDKRGEATKTFYAALTPEQQKVFDTEHQKHGQKGSHGGSNGPWHHGPADAMKG